MKQRCQRSAGRSNHSAPVCPVKTITVINDDAERLAFMTRAAWKAVWVCRDGQRANDSRLLHDAFTAAGPLPDGDGYVWIAADSQVARVKASGYWMIGQADAHVNIEN